MRPETRYARSGNVHVAYQVTGEGLVDLVWAPGTASHLDLDWDLPAKARFIEGLSSFCRLIRFDKRGTGLSDRLSALGTLEERTDDIRAVMDAAGSANAVIFGVSEGASMACLFAATYPQRTRSLIVWGGAARTVQAEDYPWGLTPAEIERKVTHLGEHGIDTEYLTGWGAGLGRSVDQALLDWFLRYARASTSPSAVAALEQMNARIDIRPILPSVRVPTLVMNRTEDPIAHLEAARDLAARIPGARFVIFPGATHQIYAIEPERVLTEIREFVTGTRTRVPTDRFLATVLFVDIVNSTEQAARMRDAAWRDLLEQFYERARRQLTEFGGVEVDTTGDGLFARFEGPSRAIRCARAVRREISELGLQIRIGLHAGEVEVIGPKLGGIAVHIGARIMSKAGANEVIVSSTVKDLVAGSDVEFEDRGVHVLAGIPGTWRLFAVAG